MINLFSAVRASGSCAIKVLTASVLPCRFCFSLSCSAKSQPAAEAPAVEDPENQSTGMVDMVQMFNTSLRKKSKAINCDRLRHFCPSHLASIRFRPGQLTAQCSLLKGVETELHENTTFSDDFLNRPGAISTLFVRKG